MKIYVVKTHYSGGTQNILVTTDENMAQNSYQESPEYRSIDIWEDGYCVETIGE